MSKTIVTGPPTYIIYTRDGRCYDSKTSDLQKAVMIAALDKQGWFVLDRQWYWNPVRKDWEPNKSDHNLIPATPCHEHNNRVLASYACGVV